MYPRLKVAKDLLSENGILFISIDDRELDNVRKMCDEIFGFSNRLDRGSMIWVNRGSSKGFTKIVKNHEFILFSQYSSVFLTNSLQKSVSFT